MRMDMAGSSMQSRRAASYTRPVAGIARVVAIGASNLTRGFQTVVATARTAWGPDVQLVAALGHGRS